MSALWGYRPDQTPLTLTSRPGIVARRELFDLLADAQRVTVLCAPAGSGKTSLLRSWIAETGLDESAAWVTVEREEEDPQRFWLSVAARAAPHERRVSARSKRSRRTRS